VGSGQINLHQHTQHGHYNGRDTRGGFTVVSGLTVGARLRALFPDASHRTLKQWLERGRVRVAGAVVRRGDATVADGDPVELGAPQQPFPPALRLVFEDEYLLVVDKPPGLLTIATERERERTAYRLLAEYVGAHGASARPQGRGSARPQGRGSARSPGRGSTGRASARPSPRGARLFIVHRLDRETSGLLVFAKSGAVKQRLQSQFEARSVERRYVAVVEGAVGEAEGTLRSQLRQDRNLKVRPSRDRDGGREAITRYRVLQRGPATTLLELALVTGRRGQIRVQLAELGHPIVGDPAYGTRHDPLRRLCLHATRLSFNHPEGRRVNFESPAPPAFGVLTHARTPASR
jgi:23S rRNA pseudouridine1911/1915/1917 synthase